MRKSGFTLIELLVALAALSLIAVMSWRGVEQLARSAESSKSKSEQLGMLGLAVERWAKDMDDAGGSPPVGGLRRQNNLPLMISEGKALFLGKAAPSGRWELVVWAVHPSEGGARMLSRWSSGPLGQRSELDAAFEFSRAWIEGGDKTRESYFGSHFDFMPVESFEVAVFKDYAQKGGGASDPTDPYMKGGPEQEGSGLNQGDDPKEEKLAAKASQPPVINAPPGSAAKALIGLTPGFGGLSGVFEKFWVNPKIGGAKS